MTPADLAAAVISAAREAAAAGELRLAPDQVPAHSKVERPRQAGHGDYASSLALQLAKAVGRPPREVAEVLAGRVREVPGIAKVEVAGPGFLNLTVGAAALGQIAQDVVATGESYGNNQMLHGERINLEFVSANPTGPIHIGAVRWAAVGDALGRILTASGAQVAREYYFNDHGAQVERFARSLLAAARGEPTPEDGYGGTYIAELAEQVELAAPGAAQLPDDQAEEVFRHDGVNLMFAEIKTSLREFGVDFDVFFHEDELHRSGRVDQAIARLRVVGHVYDLDGAIWLRTTDFGDDKDRVLVRSNGEPAYFSGDVAYYLDKRERGFDRVVIMLGADHSGYVGRMRSMVKCFGENPDEHLELLIGQMVNLVRDGHPVRLSKRAGNVVNLGDLVDAVGVDAARYSLARASSDSQIDLDLNLLARKASDNPVFYVQYAATRSASILRNAEEMGLRPPAAQEVDVSALTDPREQDLLLALGEFPRVVASAAELREPHRIAYYLEEQVAKAAQRFWDDCPVLPRGDEPVTDLTYARLLLWQAARTVLANGLRLLGVRAPERM